MQKRLYNDFFCKNIQKIGSNSRFNQQNSNKIRLKRLNFAKCAKTFENFGKKVNKNMIECFNVHLFQKFKRKKCKLSFVEHSPKRIKSVPFRFDT